MRLAHTIRIAILYGSLIISSQAQLKIRPSTTLDLGDFPAEAAPIARFELVNVGTNRLRMIEAKTECACFEPVLYEKSISPSGSTPMDIFINGNLLSGPFEKKIHLRMVPPAPTPIVVTVKGIAHPAVNAFPKFIFSGRIPLGHVWSTNLLLNVRSGLIEKPALHITGNALLKGSLLPASTAGQIGIQLRIPPQTKPIQWEDELVLSFPSNPAIPETVIEINGYCGGTLQPSAQKIKATAMGATLTLQRIYPDGVPPRPTSLICTTPGVSLQETSLPTVGKSRVQLRFSTEFLQRLEKEKRIAIQLATEGFLPVGLVME